MAPPNVKIKHLIRSTSGNSRFPKLDECAHFHYENVELGPIKVVLCDKQSSESSKLPAFVSSSSNKENEAFRFCFLVLVMSNGRKWVVRRTYNDFVFLDTQLHRCVYDRKYSLLRELPSSVIPEELDNEPTEERIRILITEYLERFSQLAGSLITCGPVLNWLELDNRGNRLIVTDEVAINTPAVAAAYVIMRYTAQAADEISFDVGDMISVIDMPPAEESTWWRGKRGFEVGFFPSECVEVIGDKVPRGFKLSNASTKPVFRKHGKLIAFFRSFLLSRPSRRKLKQSGILKERVFGCDLGEHLLNTAREIPLVLKCCTEFIEEHGVVDGIYRLSGVSSNIQRLRNAFDEDCATNLGDPTIAQDIHSVASLLKMYFRELPNPLLTYQLYDKFVSAVQSGEDVRLLRIRDVVQQLPPPHYRTLQYLLCHLARVASFGEQTGMTPKNIAIVWAPNLLRSREVENGGVGALHVVGVQAVLTEYLIRYCDLIFDEKVPPFSGVDQEDGVALRTRPKSLALSTPTKLLSLEEARARALSTHLPLTQQKYIDVGGGPEKLPPQYHTVIDLPVGKAGGLKLKKSPSGWKSFFSRGWYSGSTRDKGRPSLRSSRKSSTASLPHTSTQLQEQVSAPTDASYHRKKLRTVKSAESLIQCSKDSSPVSEKEYKPGISRHSSPEASMDSSYSFDVGSPVSKSPSLQKHTRSSSHESYFDNSIDMMSDPPIEEEEHGLFDYFNEHMQKMQDCSSAWYTHFDVTDTIDQRFKSDTIDSNKSNEASSNFQTQQEESSDSEKIIRKQKLNMTDDFAQAKVQRLSWMDNNCENLMSNTNDPENSVQTTEVSDDVSNTTDCAFTRGGSKQSSYRCSPELEDTSFWLPRSDQAMFCKLSGNHEEGYKLDPYAFYDCVIDKRASCISSSDNETEFGAKTIVERYGNAETVLVEVHATQDSSSEGEMDSLRIQSQLEKESDVKTSPVTEIIGQKIDNMVDLNANQDIVIPEPDVNELKSKDIHIKGLNESFDDHMLLDTSKDEDSFDDKDLSKFYFCEDSNVSILLPSEDIKSDYKEISDLQTEDNVDKKIPAAVRSNLETEVYPESRYDVSPDKKKLSLPLSPNLSDNITKEREKTDFEKAESFNQSYRIRTPPSPVYPSKNVKSQDVLASQTKPENIPLPKKRQILNIPSPSSPVDEVRKKFELRSTMSNDKTKDNGLLLCRTSSKEVPKLTLKQKQLFEAKDATVSQEKDNTDFTKRKSDGVVFSNKSESSFNKRRSEPPLSASEMSSPTDKEKKQSPKCDAATPIVSSHSHLSESVSDAQSTKQKPSQPSLFTQLKVRKLQSLQGSSPTTSKPIDPWSDPILDMQEEYHPVLSYPELTLVSDTISLDSSSKEVSSSRLSDPICCESVKDGLIVDASVNMTMSAAVCPGDFDVQAADRSMESTKSVSVLSIDESDIEKANPVLKPGDSFEDEAVKRERINRIKEERRAQLREKLKTESFRLEAEEKEKVQTKFRLRKDSCRLSFDASSENKKNEKTSSVEDVDSEVFIELEDDVIPVFKNNTKSLDRATNKKKHDTHEDGQLARRISTSIVSESVGVTLKEQSREPQLPFPAKTVTSPASTDSKKSASVSSESRSSLYRKSGDIRDRVAMFERSKDSPDSCRLGPNGKFPSKQGTSSLTSSFVR